MPTSLLPDTSPVANLRAPSSVLPDDGRTDAHTFVVIFWAWDLDPGCATAFVDPRATVRLAVARDVAEVIGLPLSGVGRCRGPIRRKLINVPTLVRRHAEVAIRNRIINPDDHPLRRVDLLPPPPIASERGIAPSAHEDDSLTPAQADGHACVACGVDFHASDVPSVPVGVGPAGQLFACAGCTGDAAAPDAHGEDPADEDTSPWRAMPRFHLGGAA